MKRVSYAGILKQGARLLTYAHPLFVGASVAPLVKEIAARLERVMRFLQHHPPVRRDIQNARDDRSFEHALGKREPRTLADHRPHSSSGCFASQLIEHGQGGIERN